MHRRTRILWLCTALVACDDGAEAGADATGPRLAGVVRTVDGTPVENATVAGAGSVGRTGPDGVFSLAAHPGQQIVQVVADGHLPRAFNLRVRTDEPTILHPTLLPHAPARRADATGQLTTDAGLVAIARDDTWRDLRDADATPSPALRLTLLDETGPDLARQFAGATLADAGDQPLFAPTLAVALAIERTEGVVQQAPLDVVIPAENTARGDRPVYRYDAARHTWVADGTAEVIPAGYRVSLTGDGLWAIGNAASVACVQGRAIDARGRPVVGAFIEATGLDRAGGHATSGADGRFVLAADRLARLDVAAWHADLGDTRAVDFDGDVASLPAFEGDASCVDMGELMVARGRFEGPVIAENCFAALPDALRASCAAPLFDAGACFNVDGACVAWLGDAPFEVNYRWETGARMVARSLAANAQGEPIAAVDYYGSEGLCLDVELPWQFVSPDEMPVPEPQLTRVPGVGDFWVLADGDDIEVECPDGGIERIPEAVADEFRRCLTSPRLEVECLAVEGPPPEPGGAGQLCNAAVDCPGRDVCCRVAPRQPSGVCVAAAVCAQVGGAP